MGADTVEDRQAAATRFLSTMPVMEGVFQKAVARAPDNSDEKKALLARRLQVHADLVERAMMEALTQHFSAAEIDGLTRLYASLEGRSLLEKMPAFTADVTARLTPVVQPAIEEFLKP